MNDPAWCGVVAAMTALEGGANEQVKSVATLIEHEWWRRFMLPNGQLVEHPSFAHFVRTEQLEGLGIRDPRAWARSLGEHSNYKKNASLIVRTLDDQIEPLGPPKVHTGSSRITRSDDSDYVIARLKRDNPVLADQVIAGDITPHAAAVQAGIRRPRATFATDDVGRAVDALLRHYPLDDVLYEVVERLPGAPS